MLRRGKAIPWRGYVFWVPEDGVVQVVALGL